MGSVNLGATTPSGVGVERFVSRSSPVCRGRPVRCRGCGGSTVGAFGHRPLAHRRGGPTLSITLLYGAGEASIPDCTRSLIGYVRARISLKACPLCGAGSKPLRPSAALSCGLFRYGCHAVSAVCGGC